MDVTFAIYAKDTDVTPLWTEVHNGTHQITFDEGYFSVELGAVTAFPKDLFDGSTRYLGITVGS